MKIDRQTSITKFSVFFVQRWRISLLFLAVILIIGFLTYALMLKREGMPPINSPMGMVTVPYFIDDENKIDREITIPIEQAISDLAEVKKIYSSSDDNFSIIQIMFENDVTSQDGMNLVRAKIKDVNNLPPGAVVEYQTFDFGKIDNFHDLLFTLTSDDKSYTQLQEAAEIVTQNLRRNSSISNADVAEVLTTEKNPITGRDVINRSKVSRFGDRVGGEIKFTNAVYIGVSKKDEDLSVIEFSDIVKREVDRVLEKEELEGYTATFSTGDPSISLKEQISSLQESAIEALIVVLIVIFFVINWRASLVTVIFIPTVFAATFIGFNIIGYSINSITLFGLVLVLGLFVDDAIVVVEAIDAQKQKGLRGLDAIKRAVTKVGVADVLGTSTTMLLFVPIALISGVFGEFVRTMPVTVIIALALSLVIALSLIPFLSNLIIRDKNESAKKSILSKVDDILLIPGIKFNEAGVLVGRFVNYYISRPIVLTLVFIASIALILGGLSMAGQVPFEIFPSPSDTNAINVTVTLPDGATADEAEETTKQIEEDLKASFSDQIEHVSYFEFDGRQIYMYAELDDIHERDITSKEIVDDLNNTFTKYQSSFKAAAAQVGVGPIPVDYQYQMQVYDEDVETLKTASDSIRSYISGIKISDDVKVEDVIVINTANISKIDGRRYFSIMAKITKSKNSSGDLQALSNKVKDYYTEERIASLGLAEDGLGYDLGFESELTDSMNSLYLGLMIALAVMYALLVLRFDSFTKPILVFLGIPFSFPLLFTGLSATGNKFSFFVIIGITALIGIIANNSIMLLDFAQARVIEEGKNPKDAIVGAVKRRFRPLVATTTITVAGLLPLAINDPFWSPLALSIIFGLLSSTTLIILAFPAYYYGLEKVTNKFSQGVKRLF